MEGDTAEWRARMLRDWGLDRSAIDAWLRTGYDPAGIEEWYMQNSDTKKSPSSQIGGRHFSRNDDTLLMTPGSTLAVEVYNAMASDDVAVVDLNVVVDGKNFIIQGSSKRAPGDAPDRELGTSLAVVRALQTLARRIERQVNERIKQNDWIAAQRPLVAQQRSERKKVPLPKNDFQELIGVIEKAGYALVPMAGDSEIPYALVVEVEEAS